MHTLESIQYQAALAIAGAWKGTSTEKHIKNLVGNLSIIVDQAVPAFPNSLHGFDSGSFMVKDFWISSIS